MISETKCRYYTPEPCSQITNRETCIRAIVLKSIYLLFFFRYQKSDSELSSLNGKIDAVSRP